MILLASLPGYAPGYLALSFSNVRLFPRPVSYYFINKSISVCSCVFIDLHYMSEHPGQTIESLRALLPNSLFSTQGDVLHYYGKPPSALQSVRDHLPPQLWDAHPSPLVSGPGPLLSEQFHVTAQVSGTCLSASAPRPEHLPFLLFGHRGRALETML